jgi:hypothetical protein
MKSLCNDQWSLASGACRNLPDLLDTHRQRRAACGTDRLRD